MNFEGPAEERQLEGPDPFEFALGHRLDLLGELYGLVTHWLQQGRPLGSQTHRFSPWAATVGGILEAFGIHGFLENFAAVSTTLNSTLDHLSALAETAIADKDGPWIEPGNKDAGRKRSRLARTWEPLLKQAKVNLPALTGECSAHGKATQIGDNLKRSLNRDIPVEVGGRPGTACLHDVEPRSNQRGYYFEVTWSPSEAWNGDGPRPPADHVHPRLRSADARDESVIQTQRSSTPTDFPAGNPNRQCTPSVTSSTNSGGNAEEW